MAELKRVMLLQHTKRPFQDNWQDLPQPPMEEIQAHVRNGGNIGYQTGFSSGPLIVDIDVPDEAQPFLDRWRSFLETCPRVRTASGKLHFYTSYPEGVEHIPSKIGRGRNVPGIDLIADSTDGDGGHQVVAPPSYVIDPEKGIDGRYVWETQNTIVNSTPPAMPAEMLAEFMTQQTEAMGDDDDFGIVRPTGSVDHTINPLDDTAPIPDGERNDTLTRIASMIIRRTGHQEYEAILPELMAANNERCHPPLSEAEVTIIAQSMCRRDRREHPERMPRPEVSQEEIVTATPASEIPLPDALDLGDDDDFGGVAPAPPMMPEGEFLRPELLPLIGTPMPPCTEAKDANDCAKWMLANVFGAGLVVLGEQYLVRDSTRHVWREVPKAYVAAAVQKCFNSTRSCTENVVYSLSNLTYYPQSDYPMWYTPRGSRPSGYPEDPRNLVPFRNGLLDVASNTLLPHVPQLLTLAQMPFDYDPDAQCPRWTRFLGDLWDSAESDRAIALRRWFGYCLVPDVSQHKSAVIHGKKRGGKSTIAKILHSLIGDHGVAACSLASLASTHGLSPLVGKSLAISYDAHVPTHGAGVLIEILKSIIAGDPQQINQKYMRQYTTRLYARLLIVCNEMPRLDDADSALAARFIPIRCDRSFFGHEDTDLPDRLSEELPGIANWALQGLREYREEGRLFMPREGIEDLQTLRRATNPVAAFMEDCCVISMFPEEDPTVAPVAAMALFAEWNRWCVENNYRGVGTQMRFLDKIRSVSPEIHVQRRGNKDYILGIRLLTNAESRI